MSSYMNRKTWKFSDFQPVHLAWLATVVAVIGLSTSKAALSICTGALAFAAIWQMWQERSIRPLWRDTRGVVQSLLFFLPLVSVLFTEHYAIWQEDLVIKLSLLSLPLAYSILPRFSEKQFFVILAAFILTLSLIALLTLWTYFQDFAAVTESIRYNKHIKIVRKTSHIHFGLMLAFSVFLGIAHLASRKVFFHKAERILFFAAVIINLAGLHILTSRSGLLAFYGVLLLMSIVLIIRNKRFILGSAILVFIITAPLLSYYLIPSFQHRINVSRYDIEQSLSTSGQSRNFSIGMRLLAWKTSMKVFQEYPIWGSSPADLESELLKQYEADGITLDFTTPMHMPHNQYLEHLAGLGIAGIFTLIFVLLHPIIFNRDENSIVFLSFVVMFMLIMLVESLLERQITIAFYSIFLMLLPKMSWLRITI